MLPKIFVSLIFVGICYAVCEPQECEIGGIGYCGKFPWGKKEGCYCPPGWLHFKNDGTKHCVPMRDEIPQLWDGIAYLITAVEAAMVISCVVLLIMYGDSRKNVRLHRFVRGSLVVTMVLGILGIILWGVDPFGIYHRLTFFEYSIISQFSLDMIVVDFGAVLFSWIEVYEFTIQKFQNEVMLKKINSNYIPREYTVNDVMNVINVARRRVMLFVVLVLIAFALSAAQLISNYIKSFSLTTLTFTIWGLYIVSVSIAFCILMGRYSRRISRLMPEDIAPRVRKGTNRIIVASCIVVTGLIVGIVGMLLFNEDARAFVVAQLIAFLMLITQSLLLLWFAYKNSPRINSWKSSKKSKTESVSDHQSVELHRFNNASYEVDLPKD